MIGQKGGQGKVGLGAAQDSKTEQMTDIGQRGLVY